jgi:predicted ATP-dependent endonuclease of OLD family
MDNNYIQRIEVRGLWGKHDIVWDNLNPDVNILVGINGSGKSTLLRLIEDVLSPRSLKRKTFEKFNVDSVKLSGNDFSVTYKLRFDAFSKDGRPCELFTYINTFDVPVNKKDLKQDESPLMLELRKLILQTGTNSFNDYRLRATSPTNNSKEISNRINMLFALVDQLFVHTGKKIEIDSSNKIVFNTDNGVIQLEQLSSGEKQLLIILFKVFLMDNQPFILLMDEPEISLHISWQQDLIATLRKLNPNCQLIIATHSPSIFGKGWGDKVTFMEKLFQK